MRRFLTNWATKSLLVGAVAVALDLALGLALLTFGSVSSRTAAMAGTLLGGLWTFFANRTFAFDDTTARLTQSAWRFGLMTVSLSFVHGQAVVMLRDAFGVPYVPAKVAADVVVITFTQLVLLRYFVFPRGKQPP